MRRLLMLLPPMLALTVGPATPAGAAGSVAYCFHTWTDTATPGVSTAVARSTFTSNGEKWDLYCQGMVRGHEVTGPGTFGEDGVIEGTCTAGEGKVDFAFTIPTAGGEQKFRLTFPLVYGPGGGVSRTSDFPGVFAFFPTAGDCQNQPVTEFKVIRTATLFT
jgi:hypothetical protein